MIVFPLRVAPLFATPKVASSSTSLRLSVTVTAGSATLLVFVSASVYVRVDPAATGPVPAEVVLTIV